MKNNFKYLMLLASAIVLFATCKKENRCDCIKRTGNIITETRAIVGFDMLYVEDNVNVFLTQDSVFSVKVEAGENIAPLIKTEVTNGILFIKNKNRCNWTRSYDKPLNVYVSMPTVNRVLMDGTGKIIGVNPITTDSFDVHAQNSGDIELILNNRVIVPRMHGSGDVTLSGTSTNLSVDIGGTGYLQCANLNTSYTYVHSYTLGICYVRCTNLINCKIDSKGDVYCYGNPTTINKTIKGTGQLYIQ